MITTSSSTCDSVVMCSLGSVIAAYLFYLRTDESSTQKPPACNKRANYLLNHVEEQLGKEITSTKVPLNIKKSLHRNNEVLNIYFNMKQDVCKFCLHVST